MIPWIESHSYTLFAGTIFQLTFQTWGTLVAAGFALGTYVAYRRAQSKGLDGKHILDLAFWIFVGAFVIARLFHVFFYDFGHYVEYPWDAIDPRKPGYSMFGGLIGGALVFFLYVRQKAIDWIAYADVAIWGLPLGCGVGRIGCFLIHDHPGTLSDSLLAVRYPDGQTRHDHGLYLSLIGFVTALLFLFLNRKNRRPGFWIGAYMMIEGLTRFILDFYRLVDVKYLGLTPTQYLAVPMFAAGAWLVFGKKRSS